ncbi:hypothetical protein ON010_g54 [Phytophthora cinnamomi]|nr:hypothetical protein ON010_g54 [Phytophthora cinnamomi]
MQARALAVWPRTAVVKRGVEIVKGFSKVSERKVATSTSTHQKSGAVSRTLSTVENVHFDRAGVDQPSVRGHSRSQLLIDGAMELPHAHRYFARKRPSRYLNQQKQPACTNLQFSRANVVCRHGRIAVNDFMPASALVLEKLSPNVGCSMNRVVVRSASSARQRSQRKSPYRAVPTTKLSTVVTFLQLALTSAGFFATAAVILKLHFQAKHLVSNADPSIRQMCLETVRPWFAQNVSCSVVKYNCYRHGVASPDHDIFENLQRDALTSIIFEHCSAFIMPASIRDFPNLLGIEIWNVTLVSWGSEAALNAELHPKMTFLIMSHANMTTLPQGVLSPPFPDLLSDIEITLTNLTRIPEEVENVWINLMVVYVENSALQEFPAPLFKLPVLDVSFTNCNLKELPEDLFTSDIYPGIYEELALSYNPIQTLPELARKGILIDQLSLSYTSLETLPSWIESDVSEAITLGGSPVCEDESAQMAEFVDCNNSGWDPLNSGSYPLAYVTSSRQL